MERGQRAGQLVSYVINYRPIPPRTRRRRSDRAGPLEEGVRMSTTSSIRRQAGGAAAGRQVRSDSNRAGTDLPVFHRPVHDGLQCTAEVAVWRRRDDRIGVVPQMSMLQF